MIKIPGTKEEIKELLKESDEHVIGALLFLYHRQSEEEKDCYDTVDKNGIGFNGPDSGFLTSLSKFYLKNGFLTGRQIGGARRAIMKYAGQLQSWDQVSVQIKGKKTYDIPKHFKKASLEGNYIYVKFAFPKGDTQFSDCLAKVKTLPNREWLQDSKVWKISLSFEAVEKLIEWEFEVDQSLIDYKKGFEVNQDNITDDFDFPFGLDLYSFQKKGVSFIEDRGGRALIADEMGLGKTIQALAYLAKHPEIRPVFFIVPATLKENWRREALKCMPGSKIKVWSGRSTLKGINKLLKQHAREYAKVKDGKSKSKWNARKNQLIKDKNRILDETDFSKYDMFIINYDILFDRTDDLSSINPEIMIIDECHAIKNSSSLRTQAVMSLGKRTKKIIALSGTPIINRPREFFNIIRLIRKDLFPSDWSYLQRFCNPKYNGFGWDFNGSSNENELHDILTRTIMIRRLKKDVLKDLPEKIRSVIPISIDDSKYSEDEQRMIEWLEEEVRGADNVLSEIEKLKQLAVMYKINSCISWIEDFLESGEKLVVFATHHKTIDIIMDHFKKGAVKLDGRDSPAQKQNAVDLFQEDPDIKLFVGNIKAAGVGITLTAASNTCFLELGWTPGEHDQAEDRVHRIGQKDSVTAWYLISEGTIEEDIANVIDRKRKILDAVLDGEETKDEALFKELLNKIRDRRKK